MGRWTIFLLWFVASSASAAEVYPLQCRFKQDWLSGEVRLGADGKNEFWLANGSGGYYQCRLRIAATKSARGVWMIMYGGRLACKTNPPSTWQAALRENMILRIKDSKTMELFALDKKPSTPCSVLRFDRPAVEKLLKAVKK